MCVPVFIAFILFFLVGYYGRAMLQLESSFPWQHIREGRNLGFIVLFALLFWSWSLSIMLDTWCAAGDYAGRALVMLIFCAATGIPILLGGYIERRFFPCGLMSDLTNL